MQIVKTYESSSEAEAEEHNKTTAISVVAATTVAVRGLSLVVGLQ